MIVEVLFLILGAVHFMLKNKGMTLIESLLAFSIFITIIVVIFSCYSAGMRHFQINNDDYQNYLKQQNVKELQLWQTRALDQSIKEVLP